MRKIFRPVKATPLGIRIRPLLVLLSMLLSGSGALAFPPAPNVVIYGLVRDQYGNPLTNPSDTVSLQTPTGIQVTASIQPNLAIGVNYALQVPMDAGTSPGPYAANALTAGIACQLLVVVDGVTNLPIEMQGTFLTLAAPSQFTLQNLTLGTALNNDGIPEAWEAAFLASIGINIALTNINPNGIYTPDGRTLKQEYELGNYPYNSNAFHVTIVSQHAGSAVLAFTTTSGRTYTALGSPDLKSWMPISFAIPAAGPAVMPAYYSPSIQPLQIQTVQPTNAPTMYFYRLLLQ